MCSASTNRQLERIVFFDGSDLLGRGGGSAAAAPAAAPSAPPPVALAKYCAKFAKKDSDASGSADVPVAPRARSRSSYSFLRFEPTACKLYEDSSRGIVAHDRIAENVVRVCDSLRHSTMRHDAFKCLTAKRAPGTSLSHAESRLRTRFRLDGRDGSAETRACTPSRDTYKPRMHPILVRIPDGSRPASRSCACSVACSNSGSWT